MEPISFLLDTFIQLADRVINLEKTKFQDQRVVFEEIIKPLFTELEPIAQNYMFYFRKARQLIVDKNKPSHGRGAKILGDRLLTLNEKNELQEMAQYVKKERDAMIVARVKVSEMANQIKEHINNAEIVEFAISVNNFFFRSPSNFPELQLPQDSNATEFLERLNQSILSNYDEQDLIEYIDEILLEMEHTWGIIVQSYEKLKIYLIISPKLVHKAKKKKL
jgi:hypothetical protein